jgi:hypothetical protein
VRNAIDHGIEFPAERQAKGKPGEGQLTIAASQEGNSIVIRINDDGRGIPVDKIKAKALAKGLISEAELATMEHREVLNLIFLPGFSTAEQVTDVSGRGVGMDVVRTNIRKINGSVDLESEPGNFKDYLHLTSEQITQAAHRFTGNIMQIPPIHSAIKQNGKRVYELARQGLDVKIEPRNVLISEFYISDIVLPVITFRVVCSTGTYIRSLANDFGTEVGTGGYLSSLCRTRIGEFKVQDAVTITQFEAAVVQESPVVKTDS